MRQTTHKTLDPNPIATARYAPVLDAVLVQAEQVAQMAALSLSHQAAMVVFMTPSGSQIFGSYGMGLQRLPVPIQQIPDWLLPAQTQSRTQSQWLEQMAKDLGQPEIDSALGSSIITAHGVIGSIWLLNQIEPNQAVNQDLIGMFAQQITFYLEQELKFFELQTPHKVARERDMAFSLLKNLPIGVLVADTNKQIQLINTAFTQQFGYTQSALKGVRLDGLFPTELALGQVNTKLHRCQIYRENTSLAEVEINQNPYTDTVGRVIGTIFTVRDISSELESQVKVSQLEQQLGQLRQKLEASTGFSGRLETIGGMVGLMQMIAVSPVSGAILLEDAILSFEHGKIVFVQHPQLEGKPAVKALVRRQQGQFQFVPEYRSGVIHFNLDPTQVLLEFLTQQDEHAPTKLNRPTSKPPMFSEVEHTIHLPTVDAAKAFVAGVGGIAHFQFSVARHNEVILHRHGLQIIVKNAQLSDFLGSPDSDHQDQF